jgi:hypothetical protein
LERHHNFAIIATDLKEAIEGKFRIVSGAKKRPCYHPNESVLLPFAPLPSSSALSSNSVPPLPISPPPVQPRSLIHEVPSSQLSLRADLRLTASRNPLELYRTAGSHTESTKAPRTVDLGVNEAGDKPAFDTVSVISIGHDKIPYSQPITATTPSLRLLLDELCLTVDFVELVSGHLLVTLAGDAAIESSGFSIAEIEDIPTDTELQLDCPHGSDELTVRFQNAQKGIICVVFVWERLLTGTT